MSETRGAKYGRNLAYFLNNFILRNNNIQEYKLRLIEELKKYSFQPRKKGTPINRGCIKELEQIDCLNFNNPEHLGKLIKEGIHLMYQKNTAKRVLDSLINNLY